MTSIAYDSLNRRGEEVNCLLSLNVLSSVMAILFFGGTFQAHGAERSPIVTCFEGPATQAAKRGTGQDGLSRSLAEMKAGKICEPAAEEIIQRCLLQVDQSKDDTKDYYACIGLAANPCIDSDWANGEFRRVVCIAAEEKAWLDILHGSLEKLKSRLEGARKKRLTEAEKSFFRYRNSKCNLMRSVHKGKAPNMAYGACTTETAAQFALDLREMVQLTEPRDQVASRKGSGKEIMPSDASQTNAQPKLNASVNALGSKKVPVRADTPNGEQAYLKRLRCPDGTTPDFGRQGSMGRGGYGNMVDFYWLRCKGSSKTHQIYMDMYHKGYVETRAVPGFTLADE